MSYATDPQRKATLDLIFPLSLAGKSLLDIGCAEGFFCEEALKRGAKWVVGYERKEDRYRAAYNRCSGATIYNGDAFVGVLGQYDWVLLLNVLHHVKEPVAALRKAAHSARERLVIEFATLSDPRFKSDARGSLMGVSTKSKDQTFLFEPQAISRILTDHDKLVSKIDFIKSPWRNRMLAICYVK